MQRAPLQPAKRAHHQVRAEPRQRDVYSPAVMSAYGRRSASASRRVEPHIHPHHHHAALRIAGHTARLIGAAPRQRGNSEAEVEAAEGGVETAWGKISP